MRKVLTRASGYRSNSMDWMVFLSCWIRDLDKPIGGDIDFAARMYSVMAGGGISENFNAQDNTRFFYLKFNAIPPKSYLDFLSVFKPPNFILKNGVVSLDSCMFPVKFADRFMDFAPDVYKSMSSEEESSSDDEYFIYGVDQSGLIFRSEYFPGLIVVGKTNNNDFLCLNSMVLTADGEMEAVLLGHSAIYRFLSFAEMMKSMYCYEMQGCDSYPPYPADVLNSACAGYINIDFT